MLNNIMVTIVNIKRCSKNTDGRPEKYCCRILQMDSAEGYGRKLRIC